MEKVNKELKQTVEVLKRRICNNCEGFDPDFIHVSLRAPTLASGEITKARVYYENSDRLNVTLTYQPKTGDYNVRFPLTNAWQESRADAFTALYSPLTKCIKNHKRKGFSMKLPAHHVAQVVEQFYLLRPKSRL